MGRVCCLATARGVPLWNYEAPSFDDIAYSKNRAYLASRNTLHIINIGSGKGKAVELPGDYTCGLTVSGNAAYLVVDGKYLVKGKI